MSHRTNGPDRYHFARLAAPSITFAYGPVLVGAKIPAQLIQI